MSIRFAYYVPKAVVNKLGPDVYFFIPAGLEHTPMRRDT